MSNYRDVKKTFWKIRKGIKPYSSNRGLKSNKLLQKERSYLASNKKQLKNTITIIYLSLLPDSEMKALEILGKMSWKYSLFKQMLKEVQESWNQEKTLFTVSNGRLRMMVLKWAQS